MIEKEYRRLNLPAGDLRVSITNSCNMACEYCHNEGQTSDCDIFMPLERFQYIVDNAIPFGVFKVRITGGEPLMHRHLEEILEYLRVSHPNIEIGLNTNGVLGNKLIDICSKKLVDRVVIGMDYYEADVSKKSPIGISSKRIREIAIKLKELGIIVEIAIVLDENKDDIFKIVEWGLNQCITVKIIEKTTNMALETNSEDFYDFFSEIKNKFQLISGVTADLREFYLRKGNTKVKFFQSHCNRRECDVCSRLHMRVTCEGEAEPCIKRKDTVFPLVNGQFNDIMCKAIANLGNGPQNPIV